MRPMNASVVLAVFNGAATLPETIDSILSQTFTDFEFIIVDDGSSDETPRIIRHYAERDARIRPIFRTKNHGMGQAPGANEGIAAARTELIARIDADDIALPERLRRQVDYLQAHPDVGAVGSNVYHIGRTPRHDRLVKLPAEHEDIMQVLPRGNCIYQSAVMLRRTLAIEVGGYRELFKCAEDYDLWLRLSRRSRLANLQEPLIRYRLTPGGTSMKRRWLQLRDVHMAIASYEHPELDGPAIEAAADRSLAQVDREAFFETVARGTVAEMAQLRNWADAWRTYRVFAPDLPARATVGLASLALKTAIRQAVPWSGA